MDALPEREAFVIAERTKGRPLGQVAEGLGLGRERVRQIEREGHKPSGMRAGSGKRRG